MTELNSNSGIGQIQIADEVIAIIAGTAAMEVEGVIGMAGNLTGDIAEILGRKNLAKGVKITVEGRDVTVDLTLLVKFGCKIKDVSENVQKKVKLAVETMTGLVSDGVNVYVAGVIVEKDNKGKDKSKENTKESYKATTMDNEL